MAGQEMINPYRKMLPIKSAAHITCSTCMKELRAPKRCSACLRTAYCSSACQAISWKQEHKYVCKAFQTINRCTDLDLKNSHEDSWDWYRQSQFLRREAFVTIYKREDMSTQLDYILYQPYCVKCFRTEHQLDKPAESLQACRKCRVAFECTMCAAKPERPSKHTETVCDILRESAFMEGFHLCRPSDVTAAMALIKPQGELRKEYIPLSTVRNWREYFTKLSIETPNQLFVDDDFQLLSQYAENKTAVQVFRTFKIIAESYSRALTAVAALEKCYGDIGERRTISIHFVNVNNGHARQTLHTFQETILHLFPRLEEISVTLLCSDSESQAELMTRAQYHEFAEVLCSYCKVRGKKKSGLWLATNYGEYAAFQAWSPPDLTMAYETVDWMEEVEAQTPSVKALISKNVKFVNTGIVRSALQEEVDSLRTMGADFILPVTENPWRGVIPVVFNQADSEQYRMGYTSQYCYIMGQKQAA